MKLGRNERCWCGSGKKYKKCHAMRQETRRLPFQALWNSVRTASEFRECMHPQANAANCDAIISAHTVQRSRVLRHLIDEKNHVLTFHPRTAPMGTFGGPHRIGWRQASTFPGFCGKHDAETFRSLESGEFEISHFDCSLLAYRALCHELNTKRSALAGNPTSKLLLDRGLPPDEQAAVQEYLKLQELALQKSIHDLASEKQKFDKSVTTSDYADIEVAAVEFSGLLCLATTGAMSPDVDFSGERLQVLHDVSRRIKWLFVSVDATENGGAVVFAWHRDSKESRTYVESLLHSEEFDLVELLPQLLFWHFENTYFSESWWRNLQSRRQEHLSRLAQTSNPYYSDRTFVKVPMVPWELERIHNWRAY